MIYTVVCALVLMDEASAYSGLGLTSIFGGTALCMVGIQVIACKTNYLASYDQKFISNEVRTRSDSQDDELLKEEKTDDHTQFLMKLFLEGCDGQGGDVREALKKDDAVS